MAENSRKHGKVFFYFGYFCPQIANYCTGLTDNFSIGALSSTFKNRKLKKDYERKIYRWTPTTKKNGDVTDSSRRSIPDLQIKTEVPHG